MPDKFGTFVLALPSHQVFCAVHVRSINTEAAKHLFERLVASAPPPLVAKQVRNDQAQTTGNGQMQTLAYEWSAPNAARKMLFTLTTAASPSA